MTPAFICTITLEEGKTFIYQGLKTGLCYFKLNSTQQIKRPLQEKVVSSREENWLQETKCWHDLCLIGCRTCSRSLHTKSAWMWSQPSSVRSEASGYARTRLCRRAALMLMWIPTCCRPGPVHSRAASRHSLCDVIMGDRLLIRAVCGITPAVLDQQGRAWGKDWWLQSVQETTILSAG